MSYVVIVSWMSGMSNCFSLVRSMKLFHTTTLWLWWTQVICINSKIFFSAFFFFFSFKIISFSHSFKIKSWRQIWALPAHRKDEPKCCINKDGLWTPINRFPLLSPLCKAISDQLAYKHERALCTFLMSCCMMSVYLRLNLSLPAIWIPRHVKFPNGELAPHKVHHLPSKVNHTDIKVNTWWKLSLVTLLISRPFFYSCAAN